MAGRFITLEGGEGVGKTTQALLLAGALRDRGIDVVLTREPGGSPGAEAIRALLLGGEAERWTPGAEALLFAAARADHVARTIRPALDAGQWVLCDRFLDSSLAYQGAADGIATDALLTLHRIGSDGLMPDRTLLLALPGAAAAVRAAERDRDGADRFGAREAAYHAAVALAFERIAADDPERVRRVDADGEAAVVTARLLDALGDLPVTLAGHDDAIAAFRSAMADGRLHHAWLLAGPPGVGKGTFAEAAARRLLAEAAGPAFTGGRLDVPAEHPTARLIAAGSHPDYRRLARLEREKTGGLARNINVDQVRGLLPLFATTPSLSPRRVVIVDAADDLERSAANALLKNLEEPPAGTIFLLVSHAPGRLLPTIRSRCRLLRFGRLSDGEMRGVLEAALPEASPGEIATLVAAGEGAPGRAIGFAGLDIAALDRMVDLLVTQGDPHRARAATLSKALAAKAAQPRYDLFLERAPAAIARAAKRRSGAPLAEAIGLWEKARGLAESARALSFEPPAVVFELAGLLAALAPETRAES